MLSGNVEEGEARNCLHGDGTSKYHRHYQSFQITTSSGCQLTIGVAEMAPGSTEELMDIFKENIKAIGEACVTRSDDNLVKRLVVSIKNTMSDQGSVNPVFNEQLKELRETYLPGVITNWNGLSQNNKAEVSEMCNFFCKMHLLVNFASESDSALRLFEKAADPDHTSQHALPTATESGAARLVRTAVKLLHPQGSDETGVASHFIANLDGRPLKLVTYRGNRFNILFYDSAALYHHLTDIREFLRIFPQNNRLIKAVAKNLGSDVYLAGVRALVIIDKTVTGPFWRRLNKATNISDLNSNMLVMRNAFGKYSQNASDLLDQSGHIFPDLEHIDELADKLFAPVTEDFDFLTQQAIEIVMSSSLIILERQAKDQLPGGRYFTPIESVLAASKSVPTTNIVSERDFAILDMLVWQKPNANVISYEAMLLWLNNKTADWLSNKSEAERNKLLDAARKQGAGVQGQLKKKKEELRLRKMRLTQKKINDNEEKQARDMSKKVVATSAISSTKVSTTHPEVDEHMSTLETFKQKIEYLWNQVNNFHKTVLKSNGPRKLFNKTVMENNKRVNLTQEPLLSNLKSIIDFNPTLETKDDTPVEQRALNFDRLSNAKRDMMARVTASRLKNQVNLLKQKLSLIKNELHYLGNKSIKHKCNTEDGVVWFDGVVVGFHEINEDPLLVEYEVRYGTDDEESETWHFNLHTDLQKGDLIIV